MTVFYIYDPRNTIDRSFHYDWYAEIKEKKITET